MRIAKQSAFTFEPPTEKAGVISKRAHYDKQNLDAANLILRERTRWERERVFLVQWAERIKRRGAPSEALLVR
jgi:hypothetical protein